MAEQDTDDKKTAPAPAVAQPLPGVPTAKPKTEAPAPDTAAKPNKQEPKGPDDPKNPKAGEKEKEADTPEESPPSQPNQARRYADEDTEEEKKKRAEQAAAANVGSLSAAEWSQLVKALEGWTYKKTNQFINVTTQGINQHQENTAGKKSEHEEQKSELKKSLIAQGKTEEEADELLKKLKGKKPEEVMKELKKMGLKGPEKSADQVLKSGASSADEAPVADKTEAEPDPEERNLSKAQLAQIEDSAANDDGDDISDGAKDNTAKKKQGHGKKHDQRRPGAPTAPGMSR